MFDTFINYLDKFGPEVLVIQFGFLVILSTLFLWLWFSNRRKYHNLKHAIPANVVKNYLDSIIQNSTALKSSLFRGGGLDVASGNIPSVMPLHNLMGGDSLAVSGAPSTQLMEELNQKKALIASLEGQLNSLQSGNKELEAKLAQVQAKLVTAEARIKELEALLAQMRASGGGDETLKNELSMVTKERDETRDRLKEFEIIADDLANLKRLQQENEQLKRSLAAQGGALPQAAAAAAPAPVAPISAAKADVSDLLENISGNEESGSSEDTAALEEFLSAPTTEAPAEEIETAAVESESIKEEEVDNKHKSDKTPEDLLSEFEKMLG